MRSKKLLTFLSGLAVLHFIFFAGMAFWKFDTTDWIVQQSCKIADNNKIYLSDEPCDMFYHRKAFVAASPQLAYGQALECRQLQAEELLNLAPSSCSEAPFWGKAQKQLDVGFDAYSVWYQRAVVLFVRGQSTDWPGTWKAINDPKFIESFPSPEIRAYPWLLPFLYAKLLELQNSWDPLLLQIFQFFIFLGAALLYRKTWPTAPTALWLMFAFVPIGGQFLFRLYADVYLVFFGLLMILSMQKRNLLLFFLSTFCLAHTKQEGSLLILVTFLTWRLSKGSMSNAATSRVQKLLPYIAMTVAILSYQWWRGQWQIPHQHGISIPSLFGELRTYTYRLPRILLYYADVFFRPALWMFLWPVFFWSCLKAEGLKPKSALVPLLISIITIPIFFLRFPEGAYKETVLTGTNRALWQLLPSAWLLLSQTAVGKNFSRAKS